jgi:hypothetical protein
MFLQLLLHFLKAPVLSLTDLPEWDVDTAVWPRFRIVVTDGGVLAHSLRYIGIYQFIQTHIIFVA